MQLLARCIVSDSSSAGESSLNSVEPSLSSFLNWQDLPSRFAQSVNFGGPLSSALLIPFHLLPARCYQGLPLKDAGVSTFISQPCTGLTQSTTSSSTSRNWQRHWCLHCRWHHIPHPRRPPDHLDPTSDAVLQKQASFCLPKYLGAKDPYLRYREQRYYRMRRRAHDQCVDFRCGRHIVVSFLKNNYDKLLCRGELALTLRLLHQAKYSTTAVTSP